MKKKKYADLAQLEERIPCKDKVQGSSPWCSIQWNKTLKKSVLVGTKGYKRTIWKNKKFLL